MKRFFLICLIGCGYLAGAQDAPKWQGKFEQLGQTLPTPNEYRTGSGAPGPKYWQQQADYEIDLELHDDTQQVTGKESITYYNNSPETLKYLWLQLDQNRRAQNSMTDQTGTNNMRDTLNTKGIAGMLTPEFDGGFKIASVKGADGKPLEHFINYTMMRIDLPKPLKAGEKYTFSVEWKYNINDRMVDHGRSGMEYFPEEDNYIYTIAQFYPRMCVFDDYEGWQNKQFLGRGEFALAFGNFKVRITVPADHIIAATGELQNAKEVLTKTEQERFEQAKTSFDKPVIIVTESEATKKEKTKAKDKKTWEFHADNVRDFAFATSRKFIWDAQAVKIGDKTPLAMSFYPKEGNPLWEKESTKAVRNTLITYSKYTLDFPYPVAISVHTADIGMEYPMICFNWGRPVNGKYDDRIKYRMIGVIVHEVGHNFFPMIINNDERQWTWMDEGLNTFVQYRTEAECYENFPSRRGPAAKLVPYMKGSDNVKRPLMTNSEQIIQFGNEQYAKCATALNILRETVMGPELFDKSFKEYAQRWAFKHPKPADFFRTMEDASAVDLDWFWRGWFYTTDHVDMTLENVKWYRLDAGKANLEGKDKKVKRGNLSANEGTALNFDGGPQPFHVIPTDDRFYGEFKNRVDDKAIISKLDGKNIYEVKLNSNGGLVMPVILEWTYKDGSKEIDRIPAEVWRMNEEEVTKVFVKDKEVASVTLDPLKETTDVDESDNVFPREDMPSKFDSFKNKSSKSGGR